MVYRVYRPNADESHLLPEVVSKPVCASFRIYAYQIALITEIASNLARNTQSDLSVNSGPQ